MPFKPSNDALKRIIYRLFFAKTGKKHHDLAINKLIYCQTLIKRTGRGEGKKMIIVEVRSSEMNGQTNYTRVRMPSNVSAASIPHV